MKKSFNIILLVFIVSVLTAFLTVKTIPLSPPPAVQQQKEKTDAVYNRIIKSGELNCGYVVYSPYFTKDANTGKLGGIFFDITNELGKRLNLKINWTVESGWGTYTQDISLGRMDALCSGIWAEAAAGREIGYSIPLLFAGVEAYARADDNRFDNHYEAINSPDIKIATSDGSVNDLIGKTDFPKATRVALPNLTDYSQVIENVITKKADITFLETPKALEYLAKNPGTLKKIPPGKPLRVYRTVYGLKQDEIRLQSMINTALHEMQDSGFIESVLEKYETQNNPIFYRTSPPYEAK